MVTGGAYVEFALATLWRNGNVPPALRSDPIEVTRLVARHLGVR